MPPARGVARRGEGVRRARPLRSAPLLCSSLRSAADPPPLAGQSRGRGRTALHGSGGGNWSRDSLPFSPAIREAGRAGGCGGVEGARRGWQGSFNLLGEGREMRVLARGGWGVRGVPLASSRFLPKSCSLFKNCSPGIAVPEPGSLSPPLTLSKTLWLQQ